jgi:hypothetical protein
VGSPFDAETQVRLRRPLAAQAKPARNVLDGAEHSAALISRGRDHRSIPGGVTASLNCLAIGGSPPRKLQSQRSAGAGFRFFAERGGHIFEQCTAVGEIRKLAVFQC